MTPERLARIREDEQRAAAGSLGVKDLVFAGFPDGERRLLTALGLAAEPPPGRAVPAA